MNEMKFKTNIKCEGCVAKVTSSLNEAVGENHWKVDLASATKTLTIEGESDHQKVVKALEKVGYKAEKI